MLRDLGKAFLAVVLLFVIVWLILAATPPFGLALYNTVIAPGIFVADVLRPLVNMAGDGDLALVAAVFFFGSVFCWWLVFFIALRIWKLVETVRSR